MNEKEKFPIGVIFMLIAVIVVPVSFIVVCGKLSETGYNDLCLPLIMLAILIMSVLLMIANKLTPQKSGTYKGITYNLYLYLPCEIVCTAISGVSTVILFIVYAAASPEKRTAPIFIIWFISLAVIVVALFGFHPHSTAKKNSFNDNGTLTITGLDHYTKLRSFIDIDKEQLIFHEGNRDVTVPFKDITDIQIIPSARDRHLHKSIRFDNTGDMVFTQNESMMELLNTVKISFIINGAMVTKSLAVDDVMLPMCSNLKKRVHG